MNAKVCALLGMLLLVYTANASQLISNGDFGTGDLTDWTVTDSLGLGDFSVTNSIYTPDTGNDTVGALSPSTFYAVSDDYAPQTEDLIQSFTVPTGTTSLLLSYSLFVNDVYANAYGGSQGPGGSVLLLSSAGATIATLQAATDTFESAVGSPNPWVTVTNLSIIGDVVAGNAYKLEFQEIDTTAVINVGVDNVSLVATGATSVPEPNTFIPTLVIAGLFLCRVGYKRFIQESFGG